jgi:hypothetical protein
MPLMPQYFRLQVRRAKTIVEWIMLLTVIRVISKVTPEARWTSGSRALLRSVE